MHWSWSERYIGRDGLMSQTSSFTPSIGGPPPRFWLLLWYRITRAAARLAATRGSALCTTMPRDDAFFNPNVQYILLGGSAIAALLLIAALASLACRSCNSSLAETGGGQVANASEYDTLVVKVHAHGYDAELEISTDAFESYEEVRAPAKLHATVHDYVYPVHHPPVAPWCLLASHVLHRACPPPCTHAQLRELVVDALPTMFRDSDELSLEYMVGGSNTWQRVKRSTPVATVKAARAARVVVHETASKGRKR